MTQEEGKKQYYQLRGFTRTWPEFVEELAELDGLEEWGKKRVEHRIVPPLPCTRPPKAFIRHFVRSFLP